MSPAGWVLFTLTGLEQLLFLWLAAKELPRWKSLQWYALSLVLWSVCQTPFLIAGWTEAYFYVYWSFRAIGLVAEVWLLIDFGSYLFHTLFRVRRRHVACALAGASLGWAMLFAFLIHAPIFTANPYTRFVLAFERGSAFIEAGCFIVLGVVFSMFPTRLPRRLAAMGAAIAFQLVTQLLFVGLIGEIGNSQLQTLEYLMSIRDIIVLALWIVAVVSNATLEPVKLRASEIASLRGALNNLRMSGTRRKGSA